MQIDSNTPSSHIQLFRVSKVTAAPHKSHKGREGGRPGVGQKHRQSLAQLLQTATPLNPKP